MKRRQFLKTSGLGGASLAFSAIGSQLSAQTKSGSQAASAIEFGAPIKQVCAWPNLQVLKDQTIIATIFNQPCHGRWEGDLDCWASRDGGKSWSFRGRAAKHEPGTNRMNCAVGFANNGDLLALCSGWGERSGPDKPSGNFGNPLRAWACRSSDGAKTWKVIGEFPAPPRHKISPDNNLIPFGNIQTAADGSLGVAAYLRRDDDRVCYFLRSRDDGASWDDIVVLNPGGNETAPLHLGGGHWLAASREFAERRDVHLQLFSSEDDGETWKRGQALTLPYQVTGHLARLGDGRVLLSFGNRNWNNFGVDVRFSDDEGKSWGPPLRIGNAPRGDCGYPSTVELASGQAVTAYYTQISDGYEYEMRSAIWRPRGFDTAGRPKV